MIAMSFEPRADSKQRIMAAIEGHAELVDIVERFAAFASGC